MKTLLTEVKVIFEDYDCLCGVFSNRPGKPALLILSTRLNKLEQEIVKNQLIEEALKIAFDDLRWLFPFDIESHYVPPPPPE
jgi:hypothetical protein